MFNYSDININNIIIRKRHGYNNKIIIQACMYHGQRNCFSKVLNIVHIFNRSAATTTVHVRWLYRKVRQQHQVNILYSIVTICIIYIFSHFSTTTFIPCSTLRSDRLLNVVTRMKLPMSFKVNSIYRSL